VPIRASDCGPRLLRVVSANGPQAPTPPTWEPGGAPHVCALCGTRFKIFHHGPPGYLKTVHIARVNSRKFSIGLWCTRTFRGGSPRRRLAHPGGAVSRPHHLRGCRGAPPACVLSVGRVSKYFFMAPRATSKPSVLPQSTLVGFPLDGGAHAPSGGVALTAPRKHGRGGQPTTPTYRRRQILCGRARCGAQLVRLAHQHCSSMRTQCTLRYAYKYEVYVWLRGVCPLRGADVRGARTGRGVCVRRGCASTSTW